MPPNAGSEVLIPEVGPRDGLQSEGRVLPVNVRVDLIDRLSACGLRKIEAVSFVNERRVPQMANAEQVMGEIRRRPGTTYAALVLNEKGAARPVAARVDEIHFAMAVTDTFNRRNQGATVVESVDAFRRIAVMAADGRVTATGNDRRVLRLSFRGSRTPNGAWSTLRTSSLPPARGSSYFLTPSA